MKIGIDISQLVYKGTGISTYTSYLTKNLLKIDKENKYLLFGSAFRLFPKLVKFYNSLPVSPNLYNKFLKLPPLFWEIAWNRFNLFPIEKFIGSIDLFHASDWTHPPSSFPLITTIHDLAVYKFPESFPSRIIVNQKNRLEKAKKSSKLIITDSFSTKEDLISILKIPDKKIIVIPLAPRDEFTQESLLLKSGLVKAKYQLSKPYFLTVGTREPRKNLAKAISAYSAFKYRQNIDFVICGKYGWGKDLSLCPGLKILGYVPDNELACLYKNAVAFVYPSLYEGFGLPVLEAQNLGCPVISSERGSLKEILASKAFRINPESENTLIEAFEYFHNIYESAKYFDHVKNALEFAGIFTWEKTARDTLKAYKSAVL